MRFLFIFLLLLWHNTAIADKPVPDELDFFIANFQDSTKIKSSEITETLPGLAPPPSAERFEHSAVLTHYQRYLTALQKHYPAKTLVFSTGRILKGYSGAKTVSYIPSYYLPYMLFNAPLFDPENIKFEKLEITVKGKKHYGLRMRTTLNPMFKEESPKQLVPLLYIEDLNARLFGFTHGQLIQALSENVEPAKHFRYNAIQEWSTHKRYKRYDQVSHAIELTNHAHAMGDDYVVSDHPDFALHFLSYAEQPVTVTFFLWRNDLFTSLFGRVAQLPRRPPDFVFQLVFEKP